MLIHYQSRNCKYKIFYLQLEVLVQHGHLNRKNVKNANYTLKAKFAESVALGQSNGLTNMLPDEKDLSNNE